jgi:sugar phosphate permease
MLAEIPEARIGPPIFSASAGVLFLLCVMYTMTYIDRNNVSTAAFVFKKDLGLTNTQVGLVFSAFAYHI